MMATGLARHGYYFRAEKAESLNGGGFPQGWTGTSSLVNALIRHWRKVEKLIAKAQGIAPEQISLSRYR
ncbi:hypothetical protein GTPT_1988 [Tatumella ptyseos ATCC 33301]|uniref:Ner winged helix-turn-helix DNA-binding domain-containing protein n=2 Tax=Tatumella ptyseos TaxID=82987 RepID=A0A085JF05_9GAMM|nr:hypothetical protein GTPT_1988 [Tatumella ptyseos ATCC 33301]SQK75253.1 Predicted transcriptional regulator [Tatumella ptyseos]